MMHYFHFEKDLNEPDWPPSIMQRLSESKYKQQQNVQEKIVETKIDSKLLHSVNSNSRNSPYYKWADKLINSKLDYKEFTLNSYRSQIQEDFIRQSSQKYSKIQSFGSRIKSTQYNYYNDSLRDDSNNNQKDKKLIDVENDNQRSKKLIEMNLLLILQKYVKENRSIWFPMSQNLSFLNKDNFDHM